MAFGTRFGLLWWLRVGLIVAIGLLVLFARSAGPSPLLLRVGMGLGAAVLFILALGSHAAASSSGTATAVALDWLHFVGMAVWAGGLFHLSVTVLTLIKSPYAREDTRVAASLVTRFSVLGALSVGTLVLSGVYQTWLNVGSIQALTDTEYGQALIRKLVFIVPLLLLAAVNLLVFGPSLRAAQRRGASRSDVVRHLRLAVAGEIAFVTGVLLFAGIMANLQPAREALVAQGVVRTATAEDVRASIRIQPGLTGLNRFDVLLTDRRTGQPITDAEKVSLRFTLPVADLGESEIVAFPRGDGHYVASGGPLVMPGTWHIEAVVRRPGFLDVRPAVDVPIGMTSPAGPSPASPSLGEGALVLGIELLIVGLLAFAYVYWVAPRDRRRVPLPLTIAIVSLVMGSLAAGGGVGTLRAGAGLTNPIPPTRDSVERGRLVYEANCVVCHGEAGRGDGPAAAGLRPQPADFRVHLAAGHTDGQLFDWVTNGVPGTSMPAFRDQLTEEERWHVLNFIRLTFGPGR
jgi:copper transport protein